MPDIDTSPQMTALIPDRTTEWYICSACQRLTTSGLCGCTGERELIGPVLIVAANSYRARPKDASKPFVQAESGGH